MKKNRSAIQNSTFQAVLRWIIQARDLQQKPMPCSSISLAIFSPQGLVLYIQTNALTEVYTYCQAKNLKRQPHGTSVQGMLQHLCTLVLTALPFRQMEKG